MSEQDLLAYLLDLEELAWEANRKGDAEFYASYLTDDALAIASAGRFDKARVLAVLAEQGTPITAIRINGPRLLPLAPDAVLLTYQATVIAPSDRGQETFGVYATTGYVRRGGVWYAAFSQITPIDNGVW